MKKITLLLDIETAESTTWFFFKRKKTNYLLKAKCNGGAYKVFATENSVGELHNALGRFLAANFPAQPIELLITSTI